VSEADLDLHAWGLGDLKKDIHQFSAIVSKCIEAISGRNTTGIPLLGDQLQKWRTKRVKSQLIASWNVAVSKIVQGECTFQIWLEALQTKKRIIRVEALRRVDELEALIAFHEYRLDAIDDRMDECKAVAVSLKKQCNVFSAMKLFLDDVREPHGAVVATESTDADDGEEEIVFKGYSSESGRAIRPSDVASAKAELAHLSQPNFRSRRYSKAPVSLDEEILEKLTLSIEVSDPDQLTSLLLQLVNRCSHLQELIRQNQKKEMVSPSSSSPLSSFPQCIHQVNLAITWRCRSMLRVSSPLPSLSPHRSTQHLCEFSLNGSGGATLSGELTDMNDGSLQGSGVGEFTVNRDSRVFRSGSESAGEDPFQFTKTARKITLRHSREMIGLMEVSVVSACL
jgi:hypothetical protein